MRDGFVPPSYHRDMRKKLMRLEQEEKSVQRLLWGAPKGLDALWCCGGTRGFYLSFLFRSKA